MNLFLHISAWFPHNFSHIFVVYFILIRLSIVLKLIFHRRLLMLEFLMHCTSPSVEFEVYHRSNCLLIFHAQKVFHQFHSEIAHNLLFFFRNRWTCCTPLVERIRPIATRVKSHDDDAHRTTDTALHVHSTRSILITSWPIITNCRKRFIAEISLCETVKF